MRTTSGIVTPMPAFAPVDRLLSCCSLSAEPVENDLTLDSVPVEVMSVDMDLRNPAVDVTGAAEAEERMPASTLAILAAPEAPAEATTELREAKRKDKSAVGAVFRSATVITRDCCTEAGLELAPPTNEDKRSGDWAQAAPSRVAKILSSGIRGIFAGMQRMENVCDGKEWYAGIMSAYGLYLVAGTLCPTYISALRLWLCRSGTRMGRNKLGYILNPFEYWWLSPLHSRLIHNRPQTMLGGCMNMNIP
jgi:hypothetical protein